MDPSTTAALIASLTGQNGPAVPPDPVGRFRQELDGALHRAESLLGVALGRAFEYPLASPSVVLLGSALGYTLTTDEITYAIRRKLIAPPSKSGGEYQWTRADVLALLAEQERRRRWVPLSPMHAAKMSPWELAAGLEALAEARARYAPVLGRGIESMSPTELLELVEREDDQLRREWGTAVFRLNLSLVAPPSDAVAEAALARVAFEDDPDRRSALVAVLRGWLRGTADKAAKAGVGSLRLTDQASLPVPATAELPAESRAMAEAHSSQDLLAMLGDENERDRLAVGRALVARLVAEMRPSLGSAMDRELQEHVAPLIERAVGGDGEALEALRLWITERVIVAAED